jgi:transposase
MVEETYAPDVTINLVACRNGVQLNQLFHWRKLAAQGALASTRRRGRGRDGVGASEPSTLTAAVAWQEYHGSRDSQGRS